MPKTKKDDPAKLLRLAITGLDEQIAELQEIAELFGFQCVAVSAYVDDTVFDTADLAAEWRHL